MKSYSHFIQTIYDQSEPVGQLGRGVHYSVLRAPSWTDSFLQLSNQPSLQDFAVIWDEDHDERVIVVIEHMLFAGLLTPVKFISERKGNLTLIFDEEILNIFKSNPQQLQDYLKKIEELTSKAGDFWPVDIHTIKTYAGYNDTYEIYFQNIINLHSLGMKKADYPNLNDYSKSEIPTDVKFSSLSPHSFSK